MFSKLIHSLYLLLLLTLVTVPILLFPSGCSHGKGRNYTGGVSPRDTQKPIILLTFAPISKAKPALKPGGDPYFPALLSQ